MTAWLVLSSIVSIAQASPQPSAPQLEAGAPGPSSPIASTGQLPRPDDPEAVRVEDVFVLGRRGSTPLIPEVELGEAEIDALGAYDIGEVIRRITRDLGFEAPIIIVNGRRALNPADVTGFPPDALVRIEALPPEAGAIFGADPSRRVVNIVLQRAFRSRDGLIRGARPTASGRSSLTADVRQSEIADTVTRQFSLQTSLDTRLQAEDRESYSRDHPGSEGLTLRPAVESATASASETGVIGNWSRSVNAAAGVQRSHFAVIASGQPLETRQTMQNLIVSGALGGEVLGWAAQLGLDGSVLQTRQNGLADFQSRNLSTALNASVDRTLIHLPTGPVRTTLVARISYAEAVSDVEAVRAHLSAQSLDLDGALIIPLSNESAREAGPNWGDLSLTLGGAIKGVVGNSARGDEAAIGLNWSPAQKLRLSAQWSESTEAPADSLRLGPVSYGPAVVVFDFRNGRSVEILPIVGGNPDLKAQTVRSVALSASAGPFTTWRVSGTLSVRSASATNGIGGLPAFTPEIEAAFPDRFTRDADGRLIRIDRRPVNLGATQSDSLSSNLNFSVPGSSPPYHEAGSLLVTINYTRQLRNRLTLHPGLEMLDRLDGDSSGLSRHQASIQADGRYRAWGLNAGANWRSAARIRRDSGRNGPDDLRLNDFATVDLRLSYAFRPAASDDAARPRSRRYSGLRIEVAAENLLDARPEATLGDGRPAPGYGRDDQDPLGRTVRVTLTKRF